MTHAEVVAAIEARGGRVVASFNLVNGRTVGSTPRKGYSRPLVERRSHHCKVCGEPGHNKRRHQGEQP